MTSQYKGVKDFVTAVPRPEDKTHDDWGREVQNCSKLRDVNYGRPLMESSNIESLIGTW